METSWSDVSNVFGSFHIGIESNTVKLDKFKHYSRWTTCSVGVKELSCLYQFKICLSIFGLKETIYGLIVLI